MLCAYTDDTQMAELVLRCLIKGSKRSARLEEVMREIGAGISEWAVNPPGGHRAPGNACMRGAKRLGVGIAWDEAGGADDGGCGSVMRAHPFGLVFHADIDRAEKWAVEHSKTTHRHPMAFAACAAMAVGTALSFAQEPEESVFTAMIRAARNLPRKVRQPGGNSFPMG